MNANPTATLWLFAYNGVTSHTHGCIVRDITGWLNLKHYVSVGESLISRSRSKAASRFIQSEDGGDVMLMVDHDVQWDEGDLSRIARKALEYKTVVGGIYPMRVFGEGASVKFKNKGNYKTGSDELVEVTYLSGGFMAIPKDILKVLAEELPLIGRDNYYPFFMPMTVGMDGSVEYLSEDWAFCERVHQKGYKILADLQPRLKHEGQYTYRMVDARAKPPLDEDVIMTVN